MALDRTLAPPAYPIGDFPIQKPQRHTLGNGLGIWALPAYSEPVLNIHLVFKGGRLLDAPGRRGSASFAARMLLEGTQRHSSLALAEKLEQLGSSLHAYSDYDHLAIEGSCLSQHFESLLHTICEVLTEATLPDAEFEHVRMINIQQRMVSMQKHSFVASHLFRRKLFGEQHPAAAEMDEQLLRAFDCTWAREYYAQYLQDMPFEIFLGGQVKEEHLQLLERTLGQLPVGKAIVAVKRPPFEPLQPSRTYEERPQAGQTSLRIGRFTIGSDHPDRIPLQVTNELLGGFFGSRLMKNIREEKGLTYGIHSGQQDSPESGYLYIGSDVLKDKRELAISEIYREMQRLVDEPVGEQELEMVKNYMCGTFLMSLNSYQAILDALRQLWLEGYPFDRYDHFASEIRAVTPQQVQEMAARYLTGPFVEVSVG